MTGSTRVTIGNWLLRLSIRAARHFGKSPFEVGYDRQSCTSRGVSDKTASSANLCSRFEACPPPFTGLLVKKKSVVEMKSKRRSRVPLRGTIHNILRCTFNTIDNFSNHRGVNRILSFSFGGSAKSCPDPIKSAPPTSLAARLRHALFHAFDLAERATSHWRRETSHAGKADIFALVESPRRLHPGLSRLPPLQARVKPEKDSDTGP
jgi:hypothetical protein